LGDLPSEVRDIVCGNLGGCGYVHRDLQNFATNLCGGHLEPLFRNTGMNNYDEYAFCYTLAKNGLSFALGRYGTDEMEQYFNPDLDKAHFNADEDTWPRTTQLIMLNEKADLVGGLMDFDVSVASCAYDGVGVFVTPRAVFSLMTLTQIVTPFVYEERRNRRRIRKVHSDCCKLYCTSIHSICHVFPFPVLSAGL